VATLPHAGLALLPQWSGHSHGVQTHQEGTGKLYLSLNVIKSKFSKKIQYSADKCKTTFCNPDLTAARSSHPTIFFLLYFSINV
jgi:hypothetical protein